MNIISNPEIQGDDHEGPVTDISETFQQKHFDNTWFSEDPGPDVDAVTLTGLPFDPPIRDGVVHIDLRFVNRNSKSKKTRTLFGLAYYPENVWVGAVKTKAIHAPGEPYRMILDLLLRNNDFTGEKHHLDITLTIRGADNDAFIKMLGEELYCTSSDLADGVQLDPTVRLRILSGEESSPTPHPVVNPLEQLYVDDEDFAKHDMAGPFQGLLKNLGEERSFLPEVIDDQLSMKHEIEVDDGPGSPVPSTALIGLSGSGKSSLIGSLTGLRNHHIPGTGPSRTTLFPISFINRKQSFYSLRINFMPRKHIVAQVRSRIEAALLNCLQRRSLPMERDSEAFQILSRSDDSTFDMRLIFGRFSGGDSLTDEWQQVFDQVNEVFNLIISDFREDEDDILENDLLFVLALSITDIIMDKIEKLPFGRFDAGKGDPDVRQLSPETFLYGTESLDAAVSVLRRFTSVRQKHAGKSFSPVIAHATLEGPLVENAEPFHLIDSRGFDHEGNIEQVAGQDILDTIEAADHIIIVESAMKAGDRASMALVSQIVSSGAADKLFFAQTKVDELIASAVEPESHIRNGLLNGLNGVSGVVGHNAVDQIRENIKRIGVFSFGSLHKIQVEPGKGLAGISGDSDFDHTSQVSGKRLLRLAESKKDEVGDGVSILEAAPTYYKNMITKAITKGLGEVRRKGQLFYGEPGENSGKGSNWSRIKWEVRYMLRFFHGGADEAPPIEIIYLTAVFFNEISSHLSGVLDHPVAWNESALEYEARPLTTRNRITNKIRSRLSGELQVKTTNLLIRDHWEEWVAADNLSMVSFGPGSTYERTVQINNIMASIEQSSKDIARQVEMDIEALGARIIE